MRKTKIICTIGPASQSLEMLKKMMEAGMSVARLNVAHGNVEEHGARIATIRQAAREIEKTVAIMLDVKGPEVRIGAVREGTILQPGARINLTTETVEGDADRVTVTYKDLIQDAVPGIFILIDDGLIRLQVESVHGTEITCIIVNGGPLKSRKGVNIPELKINLPGVTERDIQFITFGVEHGVDIIAASFVRKGADILEIRDLLERLGAPNVKIIAKIEDREGVERLDEILAVADGIMVARGDMGVNLRTEEVPMVQKDIIRKCNIAGKPVITATHMLESMQTNPRPTRAEASDVANAICDGSDAVMLSGESAAGKYPLESVDIMAHIAQYTEETRKQLVAELPFAGGVESVTEIICRAAVRTARSLDAAAIIAPTMSGFSARMAAKYRPDCLILALTPSQDTIAGLCMVQGVVALKSEVFHDTDEMIAQSIKQAVSLGYLKPGDLVVLTAGVPVGRAGATNLIKVERVPQATAFDSADVVLQGK
ncbi:MAG: pyruvate kinase [Gorillibacterium sp.]|nr:pyruvate kinase [Gorillibacterium sp.]